VFLRCPLSKVTERRARGGSPGFVARVKL